MNLEQLLRKLQNALSEGDLTLTDALMGTVNADALFTEISSSASLVRPEKRRDVVSDHASFSTFGSGQHPDDD